MALTIVTVTTVEITLSGELTAQTATQFERELNAVFARKPMHVVLRVRALTYMASIGIRCLLQAQQLDPTVEVYMIAPQQAVRDVLTRTGYPAIVHDVYPPAV